MSYALPTVPAGANPWSVYREALESGFYNSPSSGFKVRTYVLWAVLGYTAVGAVVYTALLALDHRRKGRKWWLWKTTKRPSGTFISINQHAVCSFGTIVSACVLFGFVYSEYDLFVNRTSPNVSLLFRIWVWVPVWFQGYLISSASLQAFIVTSEGVGEGGHSISAPVANTVFLGVGGAIVAELIVVCTLCTVRWRSFFHSYEALDAFLRVAESQWTGSYSVDDISKVGPLYQDLAARYAPFVVTQRAVTWSYVMAPASLLLLNLGAIRLIFTLRRQIQYSLRRQNTPTSEDASQPVASSGKLSIGGLSSPPLSPNTQYPPSSPSKSFLDGTESKTSHTTDTSGYPYAPTGSGRSHLLKPQGHAPRKSVNQVDREKVLVSLRRAESELVIVCAATIFLCVSFTSISIWTAIAALSIVIKWAPLETTVFFVPWAWSIIVAIALTLLCRHVVLSIFRRPPMVVVASPSPAASPKATKSPRPFDPSFQPDRIFQLPKAYAPAVPATSTLTLNQGVADDNYWKGQQKQWSGNIMEERY